MPSNYHGILVFLALCIAILLFVILLNHRWGQSRTTSSHSILDIPHPKEDQCTEHRVTIASWSQRLKLYRIAAFSTLLSSAAIFIYLWVALYLHVTEKLQLYLCMLIFITPLFIGYVYAWRTGALWNAGED